MKQPWNSPERIISSPLSSEQSKIHLKNIYKIYTVYLREGESSSLLNKDPIRPFLFSATHLIS